MRDRGPKIHISLKRHHAQQRQALVESLFGAASYEPLNPSTFGKPAPAPLPFTPADPKVREWADARKARQAVEFAIVPVSEPVVVRAELVVFKTAHFRIRYVEHWAEQQMCYEVVDEHGWHIYTAFKFEAARLRAVECEAWKSVMAQLPTFNHALEDICPF